MTKRIRRFLIGAVFALSACVAVGVYFLQANWKFDSGCLAFEPAHEPNEVSSREAVDLMKALRFVYEGRHDPTYADLVPIENEGLSKPLRVISISGRTATVSLDGPSDTTNYYYAQAWALIWRRYHEGTSPKKFPLPCVHIDERWNGGGIVLPTQPFDM